MLSTLPMASGRTELRVAMRGREVLRVACGGCSHYSVTGPQMCGWSAAQPVTQLSTSANVRAFTFRTCETEICQWRECV
jgi:hypothetical protein